MKRSSRIVGIAAALVAIAGGVAAAASSPSVNGVKASSMTDTTAVLSGMVNPNGSTTSYHFEWGLDGNYGSASPSHSAGKGTKAVSVSYKATGLIPGTTYHFRLDASNSYGVTLGTDHTFKTAGNPPPGASTGAAGSVTFKAATLTGEITPNGETTNWVFQWGLTSSYGEQTFGGSVAPGTTAPVTVSELLDGLEAGTTFHYRLVAFHGNSSTAGADQTFITEPSPRPYPRLSATTTPRLRRTRPYAFTTTGKVTGSSAFPAADNCTGTVTLRFVLGKRQVAKSQTPLESDCTFSDTTVLHRIPGQTRKHPVARLRVLLHFSGNGYVAPYDKRGSLITVG